MLVPMMTGMASSTVSTARAQSSSLTSHHLCLGGGGSDSRPEETMLTTMEEEVDELWTSSVTRMPITSPATGLDRTLLSWKMFPAARPGCVQQKVVQVEPPDGRGLQGVPVRPETLRGTVVTSNELESRGEDVEGADEDVEEGEQQEQLPR